MSKWTSLLCGSLVDCCLLAVTSYLVACAPPNAGTYQVPGTCPAVTQATRSVIVRGETTVFDTGQNSELASCLPSPHALQDTTVVKLYSMRLVGVRPGDVVAASFAAEVTSELPISAFVAYYMTAERAGHVVHSTQPHGTNILPEQHHLTFDQALYYQATATGDLTINVFAYSAIGNMDFQINNSHLVVESGYGSLIGMMSR